MFLVRRARQAISPRVPPPATPAQRTALAVCGLVLAAWLAYSNSFEGPFQFDAVHSVVENRTIRALWPPGAVLLPPLRGATVEGRPLLNLSFAMNYALGGLNVRGYHAANLLIHLFAGLALFGCVRRTLLLPAWRERLGGAGTGFAWVTALLWTVHPLQTESVMNIVQRAESLAGMFYLVTLYCAIRSFGAGRSACWQAAAVAACLLAMATKEVAVSIPLMVLLYDRLLVAGTFREALRMRKGFHAALAMTWLLLAVLLFRSGGHGDTIGFGKGTSAWEYACTQTWVIVDYLRLCFWPHPLILDYWTQVISDPWKILPCAAAIGLLLAGTVLAVRRQPWLAFAGAWFFATLAPTSSVVPIVAQLQAEHRMYLPLAAVVVVTVGAAYHFFRREAAVALTVLAAGTLSYLTYCRNEDYASQYALWRDTAEKRPENPRALNNLGLALDGRGDAAGAIACYERALRIKPDYASSHNNLGLALAKVGRAEEAMAHYERGIRSDAKFAPASYNLANALTAQGRVPEAIEHYRRALRIDPGFAVAHMNLGIRLASLGRLDEAVEHLRETVRLEPGLAEARYNLGNALASQGRLADAAQEYRRALEVRPDFPEARGNLEKVRLLQQRGLGAP